MSGNGNIAELIGHFYASHPEPQVEELISQRVTSVLRASATREEATPFTENELTTLDSLGITLNELNMIVAFQIMQHSMNRKRG
ncbi:MAG: hypothetical protein V1487_04150 [bacterium]